MARVVRPGGRVVVLEITTPTKPPLSTFFSLWFDRIVPLLGRFDDAYTYLPTSVKRFPGPEALGGALARGRPHRRALGPDRRRDHRPALRDGAADGLRRSVAAVIEAGGAHVPELMERLEARLPSWRPTHGAGARRARGGDDRRRRQAAAAAARVPGGRRRRATACCAPRSRSSSSTRRRSSTTTCSTAPSCAAAARPCSPTAGRELATATGDLLFSRAFAELAANGRADEVRVLSARVVGARARAS